jgi:hypothetical protein
LRLKRSAIDSLAKFGEDGIQPIQAIIKHSKSSRLKEYGIDTIDRILNNGKTSQISFINIIEK